jgi:hypothetical protein
LSGFSIINEAQTKTYLFEPPHVGSYTKVRVRAGYALSTKWLQVHLYRPIAAQVVKMCNVISITPWEVEVKSRLPRLTRRFFINADFGLGANPANALSRVQRQPKSASGNLRLARIDPDQGRSEIGGDVF